MYIGALVVTLAACPYLFQLDWLSQLCATASGVPRNFVWRGGSTNSVEDRENGDLGSVAP